MLYHEARESSSTLGGPALPALGHAISGCVGAACSNILTYPLDLIITRLQIQRQLRRDPTTPHSEEYKSIGDAAYKIYSNEGGLSGFYVGIVQDTSKTVADSFLFFLTYNFLRQSRLRLNNSTSKNLPALDELGVGFIAGAFSKFLTTPIANIVTRKQTLSMLAARSQKGASVESTSTQSIAQQIRSEKGLLGFWSGYSASLILTLNPSLTFFLFQTFKRILLPRNQHAEPSSQATFLLAAISKAIASSMFYPFSLAKARVQMSSKLVHKNDSEVKESGQEASGRRTSGAYAGRGTARGTILSTILHIARTEGSSALYEGVGGEVLKGFLSHGITMVIKENVHKLIIQLYYAILKLLKKYPEPNQMLETAKSQTQDSLNSLRRGTEAVNTQAKGITKEFSDKGTRAYETSIANINSAKESIQSHTTDTTASVQKTAENVHDSVRQVSNETLARLNERAEGIRDGVEGIADNVLTKVGENAASAAQYLGQKTEELGRSIQPKAKD